MEFTIYNAQTNLFSLVTLVMERLATGGGVSFQRIDTVRVYSQQGAFSKVALACEILLLLFISYFTWVLFKKLFHLRLSYFADFWNSVDLLIVTFAWSTVALYFTLWFSVGSLMESLERNPFVFVNFQVTVSWTNLMVYIIAFVVFLTTLKFLRLMRFNRHVIVLNLTVISFVKDIGGLFISLVISLIAFAQLTNLIFGSSIQDFSTIVRSIVALFNALLGKSYYWEFSQSDRILGPALYGLFALMMTVYTMNIIVAVLCETYEASEAESRQLQNDDTELADFTMAKFRQIMHLAAPKLPQSPEPEAQSIMSDKPKIKFSKKSFNTKIQKIEKHLDVILSYEAQIQNHWDKMEILAIKKSARRKIRIEWYKT